MGRRTTAGKLGLSRSSLRLRTASNTPGFSWKTGPAGSGLTSDPSEDHAEAFSSASRSIRLATVPRYPHIDRSSGAFKVDVAQPLDAVQYLPLTFTTLSRSLTAAEMTQAIF